MLELFNDGPSEYFLGISDWCVSVGCSLEEDLLTALDRIYDAAATRDGWLSALDGIGHLAGGAETSLLMISPQAESPEILSSYYDPDFSRAYFDGWAEKDPTMGRTLRARLGDVVTLGADERRELFDSEFYNEFWRFSGHALERMRSNILIKEDLFVGFGLNPFATSDELTNRMEQTFNAILPHLIRSADMWWRLHRAELEQAISLSSGASGSLAVNLSGKVLIADAAAEEILSRGGPLFLKHGILSAHGARETNNLHRIIERCRRGTKGIHLRSGSLQITAPGYSDLLVTIMPVPPENAIPYLCRDASITPAAIVILEDPALQAERNLDQMKQEFSLTDAEGRVAAEVLKGGKRAEIAQRMGIGDATVRTHLSRIYEKTGVSRMPELVNLLHRKGFR